MYPSYRVVIVSFDDNVVEDARGLLDIMTKTDVGQKRDDKAGPTARPVSCR